jgi:hypothetical protein
VTNRGAELGSGVEEVILRHITRGCVENIAAALALAVEQRTDVDAGTPAEVKVTGTHYQDHPKTTTAVQVSRQRAYRR